MVVLCVYVMCTIEAGSEESSLAFGQSGWVSVNSWLLIPWPDGKRATRPTRRDCPRVKPEMDTWRVEEGGGGVRERLGKEVRKWKWGVWVGRGELGKEKAVCVCGETIKVSKTTESLMYTHTYTHFCPHIPDGPPLLQIASCPQSPSSSPHSFISAPSACPCSPSHHPVTQPVPPTPTNTDIPHLHPSPMISPPCVKSEDAALNSSAPKDKHFRIEYCID